MRRAAGGGEGRGSGGRAGPGCGRLTAARAGGVCVSVRGGVRGDGVAAPGRSRGGDGGEGGFSLFPSLRGSRRGRRVGLVADPGGEAPGFLPWPRTPRAGSSPAGPQPPRGPFPAAKGVECGGFLRAGPLAAGRVRLGPGAGRGRSVPGAPSPPGCWRRGAGRRSWAPGFPRGRGEDPGVRTCRECRPPEELGGGVSAAASKSPGRPRRPRGEGGLGVFLPGASGFESCR